MAPSWFVALPFVPERALTLPEPPPVVRLLDPTDWHLTLAFLGSCGETAARAGFEAARDLAVEQGLRAMSVRLAAIVPMGPAERPSALSALLSEGRDEVAAAIAAVRALAHAASDTPPDTREPKPHVTLARPRRAASVSERDRAIAWASTLDVTSVTARLDTLALYTWAATHPSPLYTIAAQHPLA